MVEIQYASLRVGHANQVGGTIQDVAQPPLRFFRLAQMPQQNQTAQPGQCQAERAPKKQSGCLLRLSAGMALNTPGELVGGIAHGLGSLPAHSSVRPEIGIKACPSVICRGDIGGIARVQRIANGAYLVSLRCAHGEGHMRIRLPGSVQPHASKAQRPAGIDIRKLHSGPRVFAARRHQQQHRQPGQSQHGNRQRLPGSGGLCLRPPVGKPNSGQGKHKRHNIGKVQKRRMNLCRPSRTQ